MKASLKKLLSGDDFGEVSELRRRIMKSNAAKNTRPELIVRSIVHRMGYRFRLHKQDLPGCPDIVLTRHRKIIEVRGCFWHMHGCPLGRRSPKHNAAYWRAKLNGNKRRDARNLRSLRSLGWRVLVVWECQTLPGQESELVRLLCSFLTEDSSGRRAVSDRHARAG